MPEDQTEQRQAPSAPAVRHRAEAPPIDANVGVWHECVVGPHEPPHSRVSGRRLLGIDAVRGLAVFGMVVVHLLPEDGGQVASSIWLALSGRSAAAFAVLAGVGIALMVGQRTSVSLASYRTARTTLLVRAAAIGLLGLGLGGVVSFDAAVVILPYYALMFVVSIPLLRLSTRGLIATTSTLAVLLPVLSFLLRDRAAVPQLGNLTLSHLLEQPARFVAELALTGTFPVLPWVAYVAAGLALGRFALGSRRVLVKISVVGAGLAVGAVLASRMLLRVGGAHLTEAAVREGQLDALSELAAAGGDGTVPTWSPWLLVLRAPHTGTPIEILHTIGVAMVVVGVVSLASWVSRGALRPLAAAGSMPLTLYTLHLLFLPATTPGAQDAPVWLSAHIVLLLTFAVLWRARFARGPLEHLLGRLARTASRRMQSTTRSG